MTLPSVKCDRGNRLCEHPTAFTGGACPGAKPQKGARSYTFEVNV